MTISTPRLSIVSAFLETKRDGVKDAVTVLERTEIGNIIRDQRIGVGIEQEAIAEFRKRFPDAVCQCAIV